MAQSVIDSRSIFESSCSIVGKLLMGIAGLLYLVTGLLFVSFLATGFWESLVWLFNTDWRSSQFEIPGYLLISVAGTGLSAYLCYVFGRGLRLPGRDSDAEMGSAGYYLMLLLATTVFGLVIVSLVA